MQFDLDEELELVRDGVRRLCRNFDDAYWREHDAKHEFPMDFYEALAAGGWVGIAIPEHYGGGGRGITHASVLLEEIAASGAAMNGASAVHLSIFGMNPVLKHGSDWMKDTYLPLGIGKAAIARATAYANERVVFGRPIGKKPGDRVPARARLCGPEGGRARDSGGVVALRRGTAVRRARQPRQVPRRRRRIPGRRRGHADHGRDGLRDGV
jgi:alkylation response protein AidB-like acyl-CoA dehydrogenase